MMGKDDTPAIPRGRLLTITALLEGALFALALAGAWLTGTRPPMTVDVLRMLLAGATGAVLALLVISWVQTGDGPLSGRLREDMRVVLLIFDEASLLDVVLVVVLAGIGEEALFRGFLQTWLSGHIGVHLAIVLTALLFGLVHAISAPYALYAWVMGLALGYVFYMGSSLPAVMLAHAVLDFVAIVWGRRLLLGEDAARRGRG